VTPFILASPIGSVLGPIQKKTGRSSDHLMLVVLSLHSLPSLFTDSANLGALGGPKRRENRLPSPFLSPFSLWHTLERKSERKSKGGHI
jgi:hypothetical protein